MRYLKIILSSLALFMVYFWISVMLNSCNSNKANPEELTSEEYTESDLTAGNDSEAEFESDEDALADRYEEEVDNDNYEEVESSTGDYTTSTQVEVEEPVAAPVNKPKTTSRTNTTANTSTNNNGNEYMVIAGSYLIKDNAQQMVNKLSSKGYNAEIVSFDYSQYHSICAGRYSSQTTAQKTASSLKSMGIDSYVHKRQ